MEVASSFKTLVPIYQSRRRHIPQYRILYQHLCQNLKSHI